MRNPKDVCVSYWYHQNNTKQPISWEEHVTKVLNKDILFGDWFDHILGWWRHNDAPNILFVKYKDMKADTLTTIHKVARFIGIENVTDKLLQDVLQYSSLTSIKNDPSTNHDWQVGPGKVWSHANMFIRKGEVGGWREHFSEEQNRRFDDIYEEKWLGLISHLNLSRWIILG